MTAPTGTATPAQLAARRAKVERELSALRKELNAPKVTPAKESAPEPTGPTQRDAFRPENLGQVIGQDRLKRQIKLCLHGARLRGATTPHLLLGGSSGLGKTSIASIIADEIGAKIVPTTGALLKKPTDLVALIVQQVGPFVLFIEEAHRLPVRLQETLHQAMEDGVLETFGGGETGTHSAQEMTVVVATTSPGLLAPPFLSCLVVLSMTEYDDGQIAQIVSRVWGASGFAFVPSEADELAKRSRGNPRRAVGLSLRVCDYVAVLQQDKINEGDVNDALMNFGVLPNGLDEIDVRVIQILCRRAGKPCGVDALVQEATLDETTYRETTEPWLVKAGFIIRTRAGRLATSAAYQLMQEAA